MRPRDKEPRRVPDQETGTAPGTPFEGTTRPRVREPGRATLGPGARESPREPGAGCLGEPPGPLPGVPRVPGLPGDREGPRKPFRGRVRPRDPRSPFGSAARPRDREPGRAPGIPSGVVMRPRV